MKTSVNVKVLKKAKKSKKLFYRLFFVLTTLLFLQLLAIPLSAQGTINSKDIKDYICIVNSYLHPNMERYCNTLIRECIESGSEGLDDYALRLEQIKRGNRGSGFVYLDKKGNNYIITNYHVIVGAYRLSVTFENEKGEQLPPFQNLSVLNVNEEWDLAILTFPNGQKPFKRGLSLSSAILRSGSAVVAAGYPGMSGIPVWNFYPGSVGNAHITPPRERDWFIQHNASINPGNSGGPLLIEDSKSPIKYSVVGINTFIRKDLEQGANFAIPNERIEAFIKSSFEQTIPLKNRLDAFMNLMVKSTSSEATYQQLSSFLSSTMINADPMNVALELSKDDGLSPIMDKVVEDPITGIAWGVAYIQIENLIYRKAHRTLAQRTNPEVISNVSNNMGGYTVRLIVNGYPYRTEWIKEYGTWKLDVFEEDDGEYNDVYQLATTHPLGKRIIYSFSSSIDYDWYMLDIPKAGRLTVRTEGNTDPLIILHDAQVKEIGRDDKSGNGNNALLSLNVPAGKLYVLVRMSTRPVARPGEYILLAELN